MREDAVLGVRSMDLVRLADARAKAAELLAVLDQLDLCQAAAHVSMAVDALDRATCAVGSIGSEQVSPG